MSIRYQTSTAIKSVSDGYQRNVSPDEGIDMESGPCMTLTFLLPQRLEKISYSRQHEILKKAVRNCHLLQSGLILDTREKGVLYPVLHISQKESLTSEPEQTVDGLILHQGVYQELRYIAPDTELPQVCTEPVNEKQIGYIVLGYKSLDREFSEVMLDTWKDWTGARYIYMYLPDDLALRKITFYCRQKPDNLDLFMYLVIAECHGIDSQEKLMRLLDFTQRMRLDRMTGYVSVYSGETLQ